MKILVLAHGLRAAGGLVVGTNLLNAIKRTDHENEYLFIVPELHKYKMLELESERNSVVYYKRCFGHLGRLIFDFIFLKRIIHKFNPDVALGLGNMGLLNPPFPQAVYVHNPYLFYDIKKIEHLTLVDRVRLYFLKRYFCKQLPAIDIIFCQTETIKEHMKNIFDYSGRIVVTPNVVSFNSSVSQKKFSIPTPIAAYSGCYKLFYLTRYYPHKGLEILIDTFNAYRDQLAGIVLIITLEIDQHKNVLKLINNIKKYALEDMVVNVGRLEHNELPNYYHACDCFIMPTRLESFSGAYLESFHFKLPIITSDLDFAHEICGDAALYFDPWDMESIKNTILRLKNNQLLQEALKKKGQSRLSNMYESTWDDIAKVIQKNLESIISYEAS